MIDYLDIVSVSILKIPNEEAADHPEKFVRANYKFNYPLQIEVSAINGLSAVEKIHEVDKKTGKPKIESTSPSTDQAESGAEVFGDDHKIHKRSNMSLANIFFKLQHEETSMMRHLLVNREQEQVVDLVVEKLQQYVQNAPSSDTSMTFIPFYDTILPDNKKNLLAKVSMSPVI